MQIVFDLVAEPSRFFHSETRAAAKVQADQACVHRREEILPQQADPAQRQQAECEEADCE